MKYYTEGDSVFVTLVHQTYTLSTDTWADADPDTTYPKITITDPDGTVKVTAATMTKDATGKYEYQYELPASPTVGTWTGYIDVENGTYPNRQQFSFGVR
jgi:uncharacterized protein YfaS (alpha-2-macroglobulin family)